MHILRLSQRNKYFTQAGSSCWWKASCSLAVDPWQEFLSHLLWLCSPRLILLFWQHKGPDHSLEFNNDFCLILYLIILWIGQILLGLFVSTRYFWWFPEGRNKWDLRLTPCSHRHSFFDWDGWQMNCMAFMNENFEDGHVEPQRTKWLSRWVGRAVKKRKASRSMWKENICNHLIVTSYTLWGGNSKAYSFQTEEIDFTEWHI